MSSPKMQPIDQTSTAVEYSVAPKSNSGALQETMRAASEPVRLEGASRD